MTIVRVALDVPLPRLFDYRAESAVVGDVGRRIRVPFGNGQKIGLIVELALQSDQPASKLKSAFEIYRDITALPADWISLCQFCARYYQHPLGSVIAMALPPMLRKGNLPKQHKSRVATDPVPVTTLPELLPDQRRAIDAILTTPNFKTFLVYGVTGSGKTEVYLNVIAAMIANGRQALMLVPEIALTPQLELRVKKRFPGAHVVSAHSGIASAARARGFIDAMDGKADIVLGTRLSVFTPLPRLGVVVVDEEHDLSFKQQDGLRYSARDVAVFRAKTANVPVILGSATPSLESYQHALNGRYTMLRLPSRAVAASMPTVRIIDTRKEKLKDGLSPILAEAIEQRLVRGEQTLLFLNRRGYAPVLACTACGWISNCSRCAAHQVVHLADRRLRCHHCGVETSIPRACPDCGNLDVHPFGRGTQRLEFTLKERYPAARVLRIDRDSAGTPRKSQQLLASIDRGEVDILVGTQMLAKGHDFPKLTLVGVVGTDAALYASDFRAPERLFAQLLQVGGRSGRAELPGEVFVQTERPEHPLFRALTENDFDGFARDQLAEREVAGFPPYSYQALLSAEASEMSCALKFLAAAKQEVNSVGDVHMYDPVPMRLQRRMNLDRAQLLIESTSRIALQGFLSEWANRLYALKTPRDLRWYLEVDPVDF